MRRICGTMEELMPQLLEQLKAGATVRLQITGTSMMPLLRNGKDSVLLRSGKTADKGDIILYRRAKGQYVLHRIVGKAGGNYLCCGDNQWRKETVRPEQVLSQVCGFYRQDKKRSVTGFGYRCYVNLLPLRRLFCRLRDFLFR